MKPDVDLLRFLWQTGMFCQTDLQFTPNCEMEILSRGVPTEDAVADFSHAVLRTTAGEITGGIRIDSLSSEWREKCNINDPAFDNIALHVVAQRDVQLLRHGRVVPTCVITPNDELMQHYVRMRVDCCQAFENLQSAKQEAILTGLLDERIKRKATEIRTIIDEQKGSWHEASYICFMRALGSPGEHKEDFENVARSLPYSQILIHATRPQLVEALMLGQAGHLDVENADVYIQGLQREFIASRNSTGMLPAIINWRAVQRRPYSSTPLTLARAAAILTSNENLFEQILEFDQIDDLRSLFIVDMPSYWQYHSAPMKGEGKTYGSFSRDKADLIIINFVIPMLLAHASINNNEQYANRAVRFYEELPCEPNTYTRRWTSQKWRPRSAYDSQALIQLGSVYCKQSLCALCPLGRERLNQRWKEINSAKK